MLRFSKTSSASRWPNLINVINGYNFGGCRPYGPPSCLNYGQHYLHHLGGFRPYGPPSLPHSITPSNLLKTSQNQVCPIVSKFPFHKEGKHA